MDNNRKYRGASGPTIILFVLLVVAALWMASQMQMHQQDMTYSAFVQEVEDENVADIYINQNSEVPTGTVTVTLRSDGSSRTVNVSDVNEVKDFLDENGVVYGMSDVPHQSMLTVILIPLLITMAGVFLIFS